VRSVVDPGRPTLRLIQREGDPQGVVAAAVFTTGGSRGALLLGHLTQHRLMRHKSWAVELGVHQIGFVVAAEVKSPEDGQALLTALHAALVTPVEAGEIAGARLATQLRSALGPATDPSLVGACGAEFGAEGGAALAPERAPTIGELEALRAASVRTGRVGLSVLGERELLARVQKAHRASWPRGDGPPEPWPEENQIAVRPTGGVFELRVAARVVDQERALSAGRALMAPESPALLRLRAVDPAFQRGPVKVALRPAGACVAQTFVHPGTAAPTPTALALATLLAEQELLRALGDAPRDEPVGRTFLAPERALDAARLGAWTAVSSPAPASPPITLVELALPTALGLDTAAFSRLLTSTQAALDQRRIPLVSRTENGQAESWLLLATPCGTGPEQSHEAGLRALALQSAARALHDVDEVRIEPWIEARSLGLLAHAAPRSGETPEQLAERLARSLVRALSLQDIDGATIASARHALLVELGSHPGRDLLVRSLSGDHPSTLDPRGLEREVAAFSTFDIERARHAISREPLRAAYLASARATEAAAAKAELSRWLAPARSDVLPCPASAAPAAPPGSWSITSIDAGISSGALVGMPVKTSAPAGYALEFLLNRDGGYLDRALFEPGLADAVHAEFLPGTFGSALIVEVHADEAELDRAVAQARGLLASLGAGLSKADAKLARDEETVRRAEARRDPRGRLVELWLGRLPPPPLEADLRALAEQLAPAQHRIVKVQVRAQAPPE